MQSNLLIEKEENVNYRRTVFVYEAARLHAMWIKAPVIPAKWDDREKEFKEQFIELITGLCDGTRGFRDPEEAHNSWVDKYVEMGWKYGEVYGPQNKIHPDLVPYNELDPKEKVKDDVFIALVEIAKKYMW